MNKNNLINAFLFASIFSSGFIFGNAYHQARINKKVRMIKPMAVNAAQNILNRITEPDMTEEKLNEILNEEIKFIQIALR